MLHRILIVVLLLCPAISLLAQENTNPLTFSGYLETYYSLDAGNPQDHERPGFIYNHKRHNEVNINLGYLKAAYAKDNVRGNMALMAGTYAEYNLAAEQGLLRNIYEANAGFKLSQKHNLWLDAGVMPSHIGFESAVGKDCWTLSRSMAAENSPYYEAGIKLGYTTPNEKLYISGMLLNGWQRIRRINNQQTPAFGSQLTYKPSGDLMLNWSIFIGNESAGSDQQWRFFNNLYAVWQASPLLGLTAGLDIGVQEQRLDYGADIWWTPVLIARFSPSDKWRVAARAEYYADKNEVMVNGGFSNGFQTLGFSANVDYLPKANVILRFEGRSLNSKDPIFILESQSSHYNFAFTTVLAISF
jgi:hypothetical protein